MRPDFLSPDRRRRAGRALIMVALFLIVERLLNDAGRQWLLRPLADHGVKQMIQLGGGPPGLSPYYILSFEIMTALTATLVTIGAAMIERRPWRSFGLAGDRRLAWFGNGFLAGLLGFSLLVGLLAATGAIQLSATALTGVTAVHFGLVWLIAMVILGVHEEMSGRGYPFLRLSEGTGPVIAALVTSAIFLNGHRANAGENLIGLLQVAVAGLLFCFSVWRTGSLWWAIGFHCTWDWAQVFVFGTIGSGVRFAGSVLTATPAGPTWLSGGSDGPEGSVLALVGLGVGAVALFAMPRRKEA
jgi:membrane protease YdiL (CAAX protease family)